MAAAYCCPSCTFELQSLCNGSCFHSLNVAAHWVLDTLLDSAETKMNVTDNTRVIITQYDRGMQEELWKLRLRAGHPEKLLERGDV